MNTLHLGDLFAFARVALTGRDPSLIDKAPSAPELAEDRAVDLLRKTDSSDAFRAQLGALLQQHPATEHSPDIIHSALVRIIKGALADRENGRPHLLGLAEGMTGAADDRHASRCVIAHAVADVLTSRQSAGLIVDASLEKILRGAREMTEFSSRLVDRNSRAARLLGEELKALLFAKPADDASLFDKNGTALLADLDARLRWWEGMPPVNQDQVFARRGPPLRNLREIFNGALVLFVADCVLKFPEQSDVFRDANRDAVSTAIQVVRAHLDTAPKPNPFMNELRKAHQARQKPANQQ